MLFLHGFLGQKEDWDPVLSYLPSSLPICVIDLPCHSNTAVAEDIALAVKQRVGSAKFIIGYSAGGRLALELKARFPKDYGRVIAISSHPGLKTEDERKARLKIDQEWIRLLKNDSFESFLEKWYSQDLFKSLKNGPYYQDLLRRRKGQNPQHLAHFLEHFSIAKRPIPEIDPESIFIHGKEDLKYAEACRTLKHVEKIFSLENTGHAAHIENPKECAKIILGAVNDHY